MKRAEEAELSEDLKEELKRYINSEEYINTRESGYLLIARHFAEWGAEQATMNVFRERYCKDCGAEKCDGRKEWMRGCLHYLEWEAEYLKNRI